MVYIVRDVEAGEGRFKREESIMYKQICQPSEVYACILERYIFARPELTINGINGI